MLFRSEQKEETKGSEKHVTTIRDYRQKIESELEKVCEDVLNVLDESLIPKAETGESKVFYHKMYATESSPHMAVRHVADNVFTGRATTIVTWPSLPLARSARPLPMPPTRLTR